jgi:hypothetical protein
MGTTNINLHLNLYLPSFELENLPLSDIEYGLSQINITTPHHLKNTMAILKYRKTIRN